MPRYYFHFKWPDDAVRDTQGVELEELHRGLSACVWIGDPGARPFR